jgi:hypothetical protein
LAKAPVMAAGTALSVALETDSETLGRAKA